MRDANQTEPLLEGALSMMVAMLVMLVMLVMLAMMATPTTKTMRTTKMTTTPQLPRLWAQGRRRLRARAQGTTRPQEDGMEAGSSAWESTAAPPDVDGQNALGSFLGTFRA